MTAEDDRITTRDVAASRERDELRTAESASREGTSAEVREEPLLPLGDLDGFRERWEAVQTRFVDEPRQAVAEADELVAEVMQRLADTFARERSQLESQWNQGDQVSTEAMRVALQRYRSFFKRLLRM